MFSYVTDNCFIGRRLDSMYQKKNFKTWKGNVERGQLLLSSYIGLECHLMRLLRIMKWYYVYVVYHKTVPAVIFFDRTYLKVLLTNKSAMLLL